MPYVVFPGNVGDNEALMRVASRLGVRPVRETAVETSEVTNDVVATSSADSIGPVDSVGLGRGAGLLSALAAARTRNSAIAAFNVCESFCLLFLQFTIWSQII